MSCDPEILLWNQKAAEFLALSPWEQELYVWASNHGFDGLEAVAHGLELSDALEAFIEASTFFGC